jgi:carbonic anhydrase
LTATIEENVLVQLESLRTHPAVAAAINRGVLKVHGWVYKLETGQVFQYEPEDGQFELLTLAGSEAASIATASTINA